MIFCTKDLLLCAVRLDCIEVDQILHGRQKPAVNVPAMFPILWAHNARDNNYPHEAE